MLRVSRTLSARGARHAIGSRPAGGSAVRREFLRTVLVLLVLPLALAFAPPSELRTPDAAEAAFVSAVQAQDYSAAQRAIDRWIALAPRSFVARYNQALLLVSAGKDSEAAQAISSAVELGFGDLPRLERDPGLRRVRETPEYKDMVAHWAQRMDAQLEARLAASKKNWTSSYEILRDPDNRLVYASAFPPATFTRARAELSRVAAWWEASVLPEGEHAVITDALRPEPWVLVELPTKKDFVKWSARKFPGSRTSTSIVAGLYSHDERTLIAQDVGATLRHEFLHSLHWRHMVRIDQVHPVWIQEGLCSLGEDMDVAADGTARPTSSWRTNSTKRLLSSGGLRPIEQLLTMDHKTFMEHSPLANYATARSLMLFLSDTDHLRAWYRTYVAGFSTDPTGRVALETVLGKPLTQIDRDFRAWLRRLPDVPTANRPGAALLPLDLEVRSGDGLVVTRVPAKLRVRAADEGAHAPKAAAPSIRERDVITAVEGQLVTDLNDLARVLGDFSPGSQVVVTLRRGKTEYGVQLELVGR